MSAMGAGAERPVLVRIRAKPLFRFRVSSAQLHMAGSGW